MKILHKNRLKKETMENEFHGFADSFFNVAKYRNII